MFNWQRFICTENTSYKIQTLGDVGQPNILEPLATKAMAKRKKDNLGDVWDGSRCKICNAKELWFSIKLYVTKKSFCC